ncbi:MAG: cobalamin-dependent protein [Actinomycetes bacterium]
MSDALIARLRQAVIDAEPDDALALVRELLAADIAPTLILDGGLAKAMLILGEMWKSGEVFLPEVMAAAAVFTICNEEIEPVLLASADHKVGAKVLLATVKGDMHDLGKNMVAAMLKMAGFDVIDLGTDVSSAAIIEAVIRETPAVVGLSALLTTTMPEQRSVINALVAAGLRDSVKVLVGGAPATQEWADAIGADAYGQHAPDAVRAVKELVGVLD